MRNIIFAALLLLLFPILVIGAQLNLTQDTDGWTRFTPSSDTKVVYVSTSGNDSACVAYDYDDALIGSNPFEPSGAVVPCASPNIAYGKVSSRTGYPDWILYKRGDTFTSNIGSNFRGGRSATEPFLLGAYGSSGLSPLFKTGTSSGISKSTGINWMAISGLSFYAHTRDPDSAEYTGQTGGYGFALETTSGQSSQGVLIEGCKFRFYAWNSIGISTNSSGQFDGARIRRTVISDTYAADNGSSSSLWSWGMDDLAIEECIFDHNGWYDDHNGSIGTANSTSHSAYLSYVQNATFENNIIARSTGLKFISSNSITDSTGGIYGNDIIDNLFIDNEVCLAMGANPGGSVRVYNTDVSNNVFYVTGLTNPTGSGAKWDIVGSGWDGATINNNLMINSEVTGSNAASFRFTDNMIDIGITNNVSIGQVNATWSMFHIFSTSGADASNITLSGNKFESSGTYQHFFEANAGISISEYTFSNNTWYSPSTSTNFTYSGSNHTAAQWIESIEPTGSFTHPDYPDRTRNVKTYLSSIGETGSLDNFYTLLRAQDRYDWDNRLNTDVVNLWIRSGFILSEVGGARFPFLYGESLISN